MTGTAPDIATIHAEMNRAQAEFQDLVKRSTRADLVRPSNGTRWTNRELLFHMLFGYLITRNLRLIVKIVSRLPAPIQHRFASALNATTRPFHQINFWGSRLGGRVLPPRLMVRWLSRVTSSLHRHLDRERPAALEKDMAFPARWDPYFTDRMTLAEVYHYATVHFDHHKRQLTITLD